MDMSVLKRGNKGVFYMSFSINGARVFRSTGKYTKKEAKQVEAIERQKLIDEANLSPFERAARVLFKDAIEAVYESRWKHCKDAYRAHSRALGLVEYIGNIPVGKIDDFAIAGLMQKLESKKIQPGTINRYLAALKTVLKQSKQDYSHIKLRKERKGRIRVISREEETAAVDLLRNTIHDKRRYFYSDVGELAILLVDTGMRLGEALPLRYDDINFDTNLISIWINKGERPRSIPMTSRVRSILLARKEKNKDKPFSLKCHQTENAWRWVRKTLNLEKDKEFVLHALRHTCASRLVNKGIDLYVVKEWLGHSSIQVTEKYAHLSPNKLAHAASVLEMI
jgi:integrase